ncbi:MAG: glycosyltransferase family 4 protein [Altibacter sp.]|nr:glycosyltransferase family 4 protein [Altibacter sp.]
MKQRGRKKIAFVVAAPMTAKAFLLNHFSELGKHYEVYLFANFENESIDTFPQIGLKDIIHIPIYRKIVFFKDIRALFLLARKFKKHEFDVVHSVTPKAGLLAMLAAKLVRVEHRIHIFTGQVWYTKKGLLKRLLRFLDRLIVHTATQILVDSHSQREYLISQNIVSPSNSQVLGKGSISGVNTDIFSPRLNRSQERNALGYNVNDVIYCYLGRLNVDKGLLELAKAFKKLNAANHNAKLLIIGYDEDQLMLKIEKIVGNKSVIQYVGPTSHPEKYLQAVDVFCLPSHREGFGTSVIEASACGIPVICSDTYGLKGTILNDKTGLYHIKGDIDSLYDKMQQLHTDKEKRERLGDGGREFVLKNFTSKNITNEWVLFYRKLLG